MAAQFLSKVSDLERSQSSDQHNPPVNPCTFVENTIALNPNFEREPAFRSNPVPVDSLISTDKNISKPSRKLRPLPAVCSAESKLKPGDSRSASSSENGTRDIGPRFNKSQEHTTTAAKPSVFKSESSLSELSGSKDIGEKVVSIRSPLKYSTKIVWERAGRLTSPRSFFKRATHPRGPLVEAGVALRSETLERMAALESTLRIAAGGPPRLARGARTMARAMARANAYR